MSGVLVIAEINRIRRSDVLPAPRRHRQGALGQFRPVLLMVSGAARHGARGTSGGYRIRRTAAPGNRGRRWTAVDSVPHSARLAAAHRLPQRPGNLR